MLKPKAVTLYRPVWHQIKANGYDVIPLIDGKGGPYTGWPTMPNEPADIACWNGRAAGLRMYGSQLLVIDADTRMPIARDAVLGVLEQGWPDFMRDCLRRHSGQVKIALIGRVETDLRTLNTHSYYPEAGVVDKERKNQVEVFTGNSKRYVGVHGAHSDGREYGYEGRSILEVREDELPWFPGKDLGPMLDACETALAACGLHAFRPDASRGGDVVVYDLLPDMVFRLKDGTELSLAELEDEVEHGGRQEGYATVFDPAADSPDRIKVNLSSTGLALWDSKTGISHRWAKAKPIDPAAFGAKLAEVAELHGVVIPPAPPTWREVYPNGSPRASLHNARAALEAGGLVGSYDVFHNKMYLGRGEAADVRAALPPFCGEVTDNRIALLRQWVSDSFGRDFTEKHVRDAVIASALAHSFNPVTDMLAEAEAGWDGVPRLDRMACDLFGCADTPLNRACVRKTMIAAVARARRPGCKFDTILVLEGPEGWNKSSAWAVLAGEGNFSDERIIGSAAREVVEQLAGIWIHENADLAGMKKTEVETVKAYASRQVDRARPAYGRFLVEQPRHSIEVGTTNNREYMQSQTGNRRFWPMLMERRIDLSALRAVRLQLWGEAAAADTAGEALTLPEELWGDAAIAQEARRVRDPWEEALARLAPVGARDSVLAGVGMVGFGIVQVAGDEWRVATKDIFQTALGMPAHMLDDRHPKRLANAMRALGWSNGLIRFETGVMRGYYRKADGA